MCASAYIAVEGEGGHMLTKLDTYTKDDNTRGINLVTLQAPIGFLSTEENLKVNKNCQNVSCMWKLSSLFHD